MIKESQKILFIDPVAPYEYNPYITNTKGIGASEQYLMFIAEELAKNHDVYIAQKHILEVKEMLGVNYIPFSQVEEEKYFDTIIIQRHPFLMGELKRKFPKARIMIFMHDFFESSVWGSLSKKELSEIANNVEFICVSKWAKRNLEVNFLERGIKNAKIHWNYFFIPIPNFTPIEYDRNKLCFFSAGHKGLDLTIKVFNHLCDINPDFRLYIANPTYDQLYQFDIKHKDKIINLGNITRANVMKHLESSLCALHLNNVYPETFGCVNAEAHAVGVPVLCYDLGATYNVLYSDLNIKANEFVKSDYYRVDLHNLHKITETIFSWYKKRPEIEQNPKLDKNIIMANWERILYNWDKLKQ